MKHNYYTVIGKSILALLFSFIFTYVNAQDNTINDPLKKPIIWEKITQDYQNLSLWEDYFETKWDELDIDIKEQIVKWQNILSIEMIAREEAIFDTKAQDISWDIPESNLIASNAENEFKQEQLRVEIIKYNQQIDEIIQQETSELAFLKQNIEENFLIIEDILFEEFLNFGSEYYYYDEIHPDRRYSIETWVEEKTNELKNLKKEIFGVSKLEVSNSTY